MQLQVTNSPFTGEQAELLNKLLPTLTGSQMQWLSGYLAFYGAGNNTALASVAAGVAVADAPVTALAAVPALPAVPQGPKDATILFGSQTGNAQRLAGRLAEKLKAQGFDVTLSAMNQFKTNKLKEVGYLFILASTHGEGDPPDNALTFYEFLHGKRAPKLEGLKFSVLALGDTSYEFFCKTGADFDSRLAELGAERIVDRVDCDVDFEDAAAGWLAAVSSAVSAAPSAAAAPQGAAVSASPAAAGESEYSRSNPFMAEVLDSLNLNGRGSDRETRHLELSLEGSGLTYAPGDAVGVYAQNDPALVDDIIALLNWNADEKVVTGKAGETSSLRDALLHHYEITVLTKPLLEKAVAFSGNAKLAELVKPENKEELKAYLNGRDLLDLLRDYAPWTLKAADVASLLRKLPPRLYSIASSIEAHPEEVHLTIRKVEYEAHGRDRKGVCSVFVSERLQPGDKLPVFIQQNPNFKLPANPETPVIMVGPGTGVAPFRAFLEEREESGAGGQTWLFYGDRHFVTDFLYQTDWQRMLKDGVLSKLDVAFSRDSDEKVYVQHRMLENGAELYKWLESGAHVYVCGDEKHMAHDVQSALLSIIGQYGGKSPEDAAAYLTALQEQGRYQRDVY
ncbi:sulfite reductase (NADPH) alpha subunit [Paenibacillus sp. BK033]|uniref:assimilatory sulfite reductase (NADPH) flavoprotein subunit n=1 Tax=Paenibacillus sp. BK033 TaxID=2512133 RepID=UPI001047D157|nr:assimilatory sulfite reductase (NADPH) flavoprotein subunit [Paenibacillus sp. BK033]TCN01132.1 sulfite reductase (NADPH) alpha subunit [Paenibacillus sp. BK033]